jgi:glycosyltransferase involved in cell wall biosynthesis
VKSSLNILQVSRVDIGGGAEKVAHNLFEAYRQRGHNSWLAVGSKRSTQSEVIEISDGQNPTLWGSFCRAMGERLQHFEGKVPGIWRVAPFCENPRREIQLLFGIEDFNYPGTHKIVELPPQKPDILHCHNLHERYFDLRAFPRLSQEIPTMLTLHDAWLMSGHCAHSLDCDRWKIGCGHCPDLEIYPAIQRDATAHNWKRKRDIFAGSRFYVSTPSKWLMNKVEQSILAQAVVEARVIPNGVDTSLFTTGDRQKARAALGIPGNAKMLLFAAKGVRENKWKDYETMKNAIALIAERECTRETIFIALGEAGATERIGHTEVRFVPYQNDTRTVVRYYQAADLYLHAALADTFPNSVLEALACGTPVVATAVGGIPEQVKGLAIEKETCSAADINRYSVDQATGSLVPVRDASAMARFIETFLDDESLRRRISDNAAKDVRERFDLRRQIDNYLDWYKQIVRDAARN